MYTTISGDKWDFIAYKVYGDEKAVSLLMQANIQYIDTTVFSAGVQLVTPPYNAQKDVSMLPPWMR